MNREHVASFDIWNGYATCYADCVCRCIAIRYRELLVDNSMICMRGIRCNDFIEIRSSWQHSKWYVCINRRNIIGFCIWNNRSAADNCTIFPINANGQPCNIRGRRSHRSSNGNRCSSGNIGNGCTIRNLYFILCCCAIGFRNRKFLVDYFIIGVRGIRYQHFIIVSTCFQISERYKCV